MKHKLMTLIAGITILLTTDILSAATLKIVAFGDSTTALRSNIEAVYADRLPALLSAEAIDAVIINAGIGGNTTEHALARLDSDVLAHNPDLVVVQFGINDATADVRIGQTTPRVPIAQYRENLNQIIERIRISGSRVILMTPNPLRWTTDLIENFGEFPYDPDDPRGFNLFLDDYVTVVREIAYISHLPLTDINRAFENYDQVDGQSVDELLLDGIHPNDAGHVLVAELLTEIATTTIRSFTTTVDLSDPTTVNACENRNWSTIFTNSVNLEWTWPADASDVQLDITGMNSQLSTSFGSPTSNYVWQLFDTEFPLSEDVYELTLAFTESGGPVVEAYTSRLAVVKGAFGETEVNSVLSGTAWSRVRGNTVIPYDASWNRNASTNTYRTRIEISRQGGISETTLMDNKEGYYGWKLINSNWGYGVFDLDLTFQGSSYQLQAQLTRWPDGTVLLVL